MKSLHGKKIDVQLLRFMKKNSVFILLLFASAFAADLSVSDINLKIDYCKESIRQQISEIDLLNDRITDLEKKITALQKELKEKNKESPLRVLTQKQTDLIQDMDTLKSHLNQLVQECEKKFSQMDIFLEKELNCIKKTMQTILTACDDSSIHTVKEGEFLSQIALKYKTSVQKIQELNGLKNTTIYKGQKLKMPSTL